MPERGKVACHVDSPAMFNRMFTPELLTGVDKVLYLDIDTIVNCDLKELFKTETSDKGIGGVIDLYRPFIKLMLEGNFYSEHAIKLIENYPAFNSGVLFMDLDKMRANKATQFMMDILNKQYMTDQPLINMYARGDFTQLDRSYNVAANHLHYFDNYASYNVIHWHGKNPWEYPDECGLMDIYNKYKIKG
jgi:lipopolysaccharide biosynthesis glycosyltransferase